MSATVGLIIGGGSAVAAEVAGFFFLARHLARRSLAPSLSIDSPCVNCGQPVGSRSFDECDQCHSHRVAGAFEAVAADLHARLQARLAELQIEDAVWKRRGA